MLLQLPFPKPGHQIGKMNHHDKVMLIGSCFSQTISKRLSDAKIRCCVNPQGIMYSPLSIANCLDACYHQKQIAAQELFQHNEIWHHWDFHSCFSNLSKEQALSQMQYSIAQASTFLKKADWLIITPGTAYQYYFQDKGKEKPVANCHKIPAQNFKKELLSVPNIVARFQASIRQLRLVNPGLKIIFTVSPVRHTRDGLIENNRSKSRLIESIHQVLEMEQDCFYFPSYEILIDILRDYRFYDHDLVHPNALATALVWEQFCQYYFSEETLSLTKIIEEICQSCCHRPMFPETKAHQRFVQKTLAQINSIRQTLPYVDFEKEIKQLNDTLYPPSHH